MRREKEVIEQILSAAMRNENVRAVIRTNLLPGRKYIHSYEFYFVVNDTAPFEDDVFETAFGDRILLYRGDHNYPEMFPDTKAHLMVFRDGITIVINAAERDAFLAGAPSNRVCISFSRSVRENRLSLSRITLKVSPIQTLSYFFSRL